MEKKRGGMVRALVYGGLSRMGSPCSSPASCRQGDESHSTRDPRCACEQRTTEDRYSSCLISGVSVTC